MTSDDKQMKAAQLVDKFLRVQNDIKEKQNEKYNIECDLYELFKDEIPEKGTFNQKEIGLKIETGFNDSWDQDKLQEIKERFPDAIAAAFTTELKCVKANLNALEKLSPGAYHAIREALTLKPKKPSFTVKAVGEE